jgi:hypothetical protein
MGDHRMSTQALTELIAQFGYLSPFELEYLGETLMNSYHEVVLASEGKIEGLSRENTVIALTEAMRKIKIELAEAQMEQAQHHLEQARTSTFAAKPVSAADVINLRKETA